MRPAQPLRPAAWLLAWAALTLGGPAQGQLETAAPDFGGETLSGDWAGLRGDWHRRGISTDLLLKTDLVRSRGGLAAGRTAMANLDAKLRIDAEPAFGWRDTIVYLHLLSNFGGRQNTDAAGSLMGVSNIEVAKAATKLFHAWVQKGFLDQSFSLLAGLYPIDSEFAVLDTAGTLLHPSFGASADLALTRGPAIFNHGAAALRLKWSSADRTLYGMAAVLDGMPDDPQNPRVTRVRRGKDDGFFSIAEIGWMPEELGHVFEPTDPTTGLVRPPEVRAHEKWEAFSKHALGAWRYSRTAPDLVDTDAGGLPAARPSWGWYALSERTLYRDPDLPERHLAGFARYSATDGNSSAIRSALNLGLRLRGPVAARPDDIVLAGFTRGRLGAKWRVAQAAAGTPAAATEDAVEIGYRLQWRKWLALQPVLQRISHPGGSQEARPVRLIGLRLEANL